MASSLLVLEQRRHRRVTFTLMLGCLAAGVAVSNERGVFVPPPGLREALAATARAFAALAGPPGQFPLQLFNPAPIDAYRLPNVIAERIINPPAPAPNAFPGVFGGPANAAPARGAPGNDGAPAANLAFAPQGGNPGGAGGVPSGSSPIGGGFTGLPTPLQNLGSNPGTGTGTNPGDGTTTPTNPGGGTTTPTNPGDGTTTPTNPGGGTATPTNPGGGTTTPTNPGGGTTTPTNPGGGTTTPTNPGGGTTTPINPGDGTTPIPPIVTTPIDNPPTSAIPEPANWMMLIVGFGIVGGMQRLVNRRRLRQAA